MRSDDELLAEARAVRAQAYAPYSSFYVGASVLDERGDVHNGCNVENAAYPEGICAEANALGRMVTAGGRRVVVIAVVGGPSEGEMLTACTPCGGCRQRILEFADNETRILLLDQAGRPQTFTMENLLPHSFHW